MLLEPFLRADGTMSPCYRNHVSMLLEPCVHAAGTMCPCCWNHVSRLLEPCVHAAGTMSLCCQPKTTSRWLLNRWSDGSSVGLTITILLLQNHRAASSAVAIRQLQLLNHLLYSIYKVVRNDKRIACGNSNCHTFLPSRKFLHTVHDY